MSRWLVYLLVFFGLVAAALFFMPLRLAVSLPGVEENGFSAREISGSIWNGRIEGAQIGSYPLGDLDAGVQFLPLFAGSIKMDLERGGDDPQGPLTATIGKRNGALQLENATTAINVGRQLAPLPASVIELDNVSVSFADGRCQAADGKIRLSLDANIPGLDLKQGLLGSPVCEDGALVLPLKSGSAMETLTLKLDGNGTYSGRLFLAGGNRAWVLLLPTLGFQKVPNGYAIKVAGQIAPAR